MIYKIILGLLFVFTLTISGHPESTGFGLPVYSIKINPMYLNILDSNPRSNECFPATVFFNGTSFPCHLHYRGGSSRTLPKKSWKIKFSNNDNYWHAKELNLNAEYRDKSLMRNFIGQKLFHYFGKPAPSIEMVNLLVNDTYMGVYANVENVDKTFFKKRDIDLYRLYKGGNGANMSPLINPGSYRTSWDLKEGEGAPDDRRDLMMLFNKFLYWTTDDFDRNITHEIDLNSFLFYFAVIYVTADMDGIAKNLYLFQTKRGTPYRIMSWDMDASFGNHASGTYKESYERLKCASITHLLFHRLMENDAFQERFRAYVDQIVTTGFPYIQTLIDSTYTMIKDDVYRDTHKKGSNSDFDGAVQEVKDFLIKRARFLETWRPLEKYPLTDFYCSHPFSSDNAGNIVFRVFSNHRQKIRVKFIRNIDFTQYGSDFTTEYLELFDDGCHNDGTANDGVYGNEKRFDPDSREIVPFALVATGYQLPQNQVSYIQYKPSKSYAINFRAHNCVGLNRLRFGRIIKSENDIFIQLVNPSDQTIDLSYFSLRGNEYFENHMFPPETVIPPHDTLIITSSSKKAGLLFPGKKRCDDVYFTINDGDSIKILSPTMSDLGITASVASVSPDIEVDRVVISEINYQSTGDHTTGDWIELYNPNTTTLDISGWTLSDAKVQHRYIIPEKTSVKPFEYSLICEDEKRFHSIHASLPIKGAFEFGLNSEQEHLCLRNRAGFIVDSLSYSSGSWPIREDNDGKTMELIHPDLDNSIGSNWEASAESGGTPGKPKSVNPDMPPGFLELPQKGLSMSFTSLLQIQVYIKKKSRIGIRIFNLSGKPVETVVNEMMDAGYHLIQCRSELLVRGIYVYTFEINGKLNTSGKIIKAR